MLILSRKSGERIIVGENVVITVLAVKGQRIQLGIEAPKEMAIHREPATGSGTSLKEGTKPMLALGDTGLYQGKRADERQITGADSTTGRSTGRRRFRPRARLDRPIE